MKLEPPPTTRVGGGSSARAAAVAAALILAGVAGIAVMGRPAGQAVATQPPAAAAPTPAATTSPVITPPAIATATAAPPTASPRPTSSPTASATPLLPRSPLQEEAIAVIIHGTDRPRGYLAILHQTRASVLEADIRVADERSILGATLQLAQLWTREEGPPFAVIDTFDLPGDRLSEIEPGSSVIDSTAPAMPEAERAPRVVRLGYRLRVRVDWRDEQPYLLVTLSLGDPTQGPFDDMGVMALPDVLEWGITR